MTAPASVAADLPRTSEQGGTQQHAVEDRVAHAVRGLFGRDSLYMLIWGIQIAVAAVVTPVITRVMGTTEFGRVAAANAVMQVVYVVAGVGLSTAIQRQYAEPDGPARARRLLSFAIAAACLVVALLDATGSVWSPYLGFDHYAGAVRLAVIWAGVSAVTYAAMALLRSQDRLLAFGCVSLAQSIIAEAASLALVITTRPTATMFVLGQLLLQLTALGLALMWVRPALMRRSDGALVRGALVYGLPLVPALLSTFVLNAADRFIVQDQLGAAALARYQVAYNIGAMPLLLIGVLSSVWLPRIFALKEKGERAAVLAAARDGLYAVLIPVVLGFSMGAPLVLRIWAPPQYRPEDLLLVTALVIVAVVPFTAGMAATRALLAQGSTRWIAGATLVAAIANVGLNLLLIPPFELVGSALATLLAYLLLQQLLIMRARVVAPIRGTPPKRLLALALAASAALLSAELPTTGPALALRTLAVAVAVPWFGWRIVSLTRPEALPRRRPARSVSTDRAQPVPDEAQR